MEYVSCCVKMNSCTFFYDYFKSKQLCFRTFKYVYMFIGHHTKAKGNHCHFSTFYFHIVFHYFCRKNENKKKTRFKKWQCQSILILIWYSPDHLINTFQTIKDQSLQRSTGKCIIKSDCNFNTFDELFLTKRTDKCMAMNFCISVIITISSFVNCVIIIRFNLCENYRILFCWLGGGGLFSYSCLSCTYKTVVIIAIAIACIFFYRFQLLWFVCNVAFVEQLCCF